MSDEREDVKEAARQVAQLLGDEMRKAMAEPQPAWIKAANELHPDLSLADKERKVREIACLDEMADELENRAEKDWTEAESWCLFLANRCRARAAEFVHKLGGNAALRSLMDELGWD